MYGPAWLKSSGACPDAPGRVAILSMGLAGVLMGSATRSSGIMRRLVTDLCVGCPWKGLLGMGTLPGVVLAAILDSICGRLGDADFDFTSLLFFACERVIGPLTKL